MSQVPNKPDDCVAWITVRLHAHGALSVSGTIGDPVMACAMLDHAKDAIGRNATKPEGIVIPNRDVDVDTIAGLKEMGDLALKDRGDP